MTTNPQANERPILFSAPMVRAILDGRKTQTRRIVKPQPEMIQDCDPEGYSWVPQYGGRELSWTQCPYGQPGDRLGVREAHSILNTHGQHRADGLRWGPWGGLPTTVSPDGTKIAYYREGFDRADPPRWRPSIHMPRWASRITLEITSVRVERLLDISVSDVYREGHNPALIPGHDVDIDGGLWDSGAKKVRQAYFDLFESIYGKEMLDLNPWLWVVGFKRIEA